MSGPEICEHGRDVERSCPECDDCGEPWTADHDCWDTFASSLRSRAAAWKHLAREWKQAWQDACLEIRAREDQRNHAATECHCLRYENERLREELAEAYDDVLAYGPQCGATHEYAASRVFELFGKACSCPYRGCPARRAALEGKE